MTISYIFILTHLHPNFPTPVPETPLPHSSPFFFGNLLITTSEYLPFLFNKSFLKICLHGQVSQVPFWFCFLFLFCSFQLPRRQASKGLKYSKALLVQ